MRKSAVFVALLGAFVLSWADRPAARQQSRNSGVSQVCGEFTIGLDLYFGTLGFDRPDEGWAWVERARPLRQATGIARNPRVASNDTPATHESHDVDFELELDPNQESLLSIRDMLSVEWETGIDPSEKTGDGASPIFPKWAWPSDGDRVWLEGHWVHDCGHPENGLYKTEIHPPRAIATMREQAAPIPGSGLTPVPVTKTDVYITGRGGFLVEQLNCGVDIILGFNGATCGQYPPPEDESYKTTPINSRFTFDVCLPPRPPNTVATSRVEAGPRNNVYIDPEIEVVEPATAPCVGDPRFDQTAMLRVTVKLDGTATPPDAIYARQIYSGWIAAPDPVLPQRRVTVNSTHLHHDHDLDPGDGELTFWWVNVDRASPPWIRLSDYANGNMNDYDDDGNLGDGEMTFTGARFADFYLRHDQPFNVRSRGYEQDCFDNIGAFGFHMLSLAMYAICYADIYDFGAGDGLGNADGVYTAENVGDTRISAGDHIVRFTVDEVPVTLEDTSYLSIGTACTPAGEVALAGQPLNCATRVDNAGPGLPRAVQVTSRFSNVGVANLAATWSIRAPFGTGTLPCTPSATEVFCKPTNVPVAAAAPVNIATTVTPTAPGLLATRAEVTTLSTDPDLANNVATASIEVYQGVTADIARNTDGIINLKRGGSIAVAIITTDTFDATTVNAASVCFGDAGDPAQRTCNEVHNAGHLEDVNKDRRRDLVLHFDVAASGIDAGDTQACLIGRTSAGVGIYACGPIVATNPPQ